MRCPQCKGRGWLRAKTQRGRVWIDGAKARKLLVDLGEQQRCVAKAIGVPEYRLSRVLNEYASLSVDEAIRLAAILDTKLSAIEANE